MNSDPILRELNRMANDQTLKHQYRMIVQQTMQHIRMQDDEINKIRDDISDWRDPDGDPPAAA